MNTKHELLLRQLCRFGALSFKQLIEFNKPYAKRRSIFNYLNDFYKNDFARKFYNPIRKDCVYTATSKAYDCIYGIQPKETTRISYNKIFHATKLADIITSISKYSFVSGIATEFEYGSSTLQKFCYNRVPDAIIQVTRNDSPTELAIELELTQKTISRTKRILQNYEKTFQDKLLCKSVLIFCGNPQIEKTYQSLLNNISIDVRKRFKIMSFERVSSLSEMYLGSQNKSIDRFWFTRRVECNGECTYVPYKTITYAGMNLNTLEVSCTPVSESEDYYEAV